MNVDAGAIEKARAGGERLDELIAAIWPDAYRLAFGVLHDRGLAEDAAQEACAAIARGLPALKSATAFRTWTYRIITNHAISTARARPKTRDLQAAGDRAVSYDPSDALDLLTALARLPIAQRVAVILHYYAGMNSGEIASATGLSAATIRFHLMLARRTLRKALSAESTGTNSNPREVTSDVR
ncbi:MAG: sigma-70 family RNA polymerase sigma factor [Candidatus Eremiobacteraeota bacterium]|nr:sigma-70 family RNA polymerase sigma factor [Candidatus Eremiobacteraeota bacterium]